MGANAAESNGTTRPVSEPFLKYPFTRVNGATYSAQKLINALTWKNLQDALVKAGYVFRDVSRAVGCEDPYVDIITSRGIVRMMYNDAEDPREIWFYR